MYRVKETLFTSKYAVVDNRLFLLLFSQDVVGYCIEKLEYVPSVADNAGYTPLHEACSQGHYHIAKLLLRFGADVSASAQGGIR